MHKYAYETGLPAPTPPTPLKSRIANAAKPHHGVSWKSGNNTLYSSSVGDDNNINSINNTPGRTGEISERSASFRSGHGYNNNNNSYGGSSGYGGGNPSSSFDDDEEDIIDDKTLSKYLDGLHCFDQICTELEISEKEITARLKRYPREVLIVHR